MPRAACVSSWLCSYMLLVAIVSECLWLQIGLPSVYLKVKRFLMLIGVRENERKRVEKFILNIYKHPQCIWWGWDEKVSKRFLISAVRHFVALQLWWQLKEWGLWGPQRLPTHLLVPGLGWIFGWCNYWAVMGWKSSPVGLWPLLKSGAVLCGGEMLCVSVL